MLRALANAAATSVKLYVCMFVSVSECDDLPRACAGLCIKSLVFDAHCDSEHAKLVFGGVLYAPRLAPGVAE